MTLRVGHLSTFYHTSILLIAEGDIEKRLGTPVEWRLFGTGPDIVKAFERDELDIAYVGLPPAMIGLARGAQFKCIAGGHIEGTVITGDVSLEEESTPEGLERVFGQLRGKRIGVPGRGSIHDVILSDCLDRFGLKDEIEVINYKWADMITEAMVRHEVSAAVGTPALAVSVRRYAGGKVLYPPSMLWPSNPSYGIVTSNEMIKNNGPLIERFLSVHEEASAMLRERPHDAAEKISSYIGIVNRGFVEETIAISPRYCGQLTPEFIEATMEFEAALRRLGYTERELTEQEVFDLSFIRKTHAPGNHY